MTNSFSANIQLQVVKAARPQWKQRPPTLARSSRTIKLIYDGFLRPPELSAEGILPKTYTIPTRTHKSAK